VTDLGAVATVTDTMDQIANMATADATNAAINQ